MDVLTQGLLGAALAQSAAKPEETAKATGIGFAAGLLADADALIRSSSDPLLTIEYHRHFTHSIFFVPVGGLIAALLLWPLFRGRLRFGRLYLFSLLGYSLSGFLDACTSYGTHLLWPLSDTRIAWSVIAIVDPVFTLTLLIAIVSAWLLHRRRVAQAGLVAAGIYLLVAWVQAERAQGVAVALAEGRGHRPERLLVKPTLGNILLWRSLYQTDDRFYADGVRVGLDSSRVYPGGSVRRFVPKRDAPTLSSASTLYRDIVRFNAFSDGFMALHPQRTDVLGDARYAMIPTSLEPLWGIEMDFERPDQHASLAFYRNVSEAERQQFWLMLRGEEVTAADGS